MSSNNNQINVPQAKEAMERFKICLLYTSPSPRDA